MAEVLSLFSMVCAHCTAKKIRTLLQESGSVIFHRSFSGAAQFAFLQHFP
jgi:hypothetical protein